MEWNRILYSSIGVMAIAFFQLQLKDIFRRQRVL